MNTHNSTIAVPRDNNNNTSVARLGVPTSWLSQITRSITATMGAFQNRFGLMAGRLGVFSGAVFRSGGPSGNEDQNNTARTLRTRAPRRIPKGSRSRSMRATGPARRKLAARSTGKGGGGPAVASSVPKKTIIGGPRGRIAAKPAVKVESPIMKPRADAGVTKRTVGEYFKGMFARRAKAESEIEEEEIEEEDQDVPTNGGIATMAETQIPKSSTAYPTSLKLPNIAIHAMTSPIVSMDAIAHSKAGKARRTKTPCQIQQGPRRRSMRINESAQKSKQGKLSAGYTAQASGVPATAALTTKKRVTWDQPLTRVASETGSPFLKPRAGTGVTKRTVAGTPRGQIVSKAETQAAVMEENIKATTTAATPTGTQVPASPSVHSDSPEHPNIATNSMPASIIRNKPTTTGKVTRAPHTKTPRKEPQVPQRRSMRIMESARKSAQDKQIVGSAREEAGEHVSATSVADETGADGMSSWIAEEASPKIKVENGEEESMEPMIMVRSPNSQAQG